MPLRPVGSVLTLRAACAGGTSPHCGLVMRQRGARLGNHLGNWPGSGLPAGYGENGISLPMTYGAMATTGRGGAIGSAVAKCLSRIAVAGLCSAAATLHTIRLRWRRATGAEATAIGEVIAKGLTRATCTGRIGAQPSAQDIAYAVWGAPNAITGGFSAGRVMRGLAAINLGKKSGDTFRNVEDTADQVEGTTTPAGDRTAVTVGA
jgi:hypothetical protein